MFTGKRTNSHSCPLKVIINKTNQVNEEVYQTFSNPIIKNEVFQTFSNPIINEEVHQSFLNPIISEDVYQSF